MIRLLCCMIIITIFFACNKESMNKDITFDFASTSTAYIIKETVNLRSSNNTSSPIIKKLNDGQPINIIQNKNGWYEIYDDEHTRGWLRSDLVGPRDLSRTVLATAFVDSIMPGYKANLYFDNKDLYKTVYLVLPQAYYESPDKAKTYSEQIGKVYQEKVYPGDLEIRIMRKNREDLYMRLKLKAIRNPDVPIPIINKGRLISIEHNNCQIKINIAVPSDITKSELLQQARLISDKYDLPYSKVEIFQTLDNKTGRTHLTNHSEKSSNPMICKLYYIEDKDGEFYKYNYCN